MRLFSLIFIFALLTQPLRAEVVTPLGESSNALLQGLVNRGVTRIGDFDLKQFLTDKKQIQWGVTNENLPESLTGDRRSAYYLKQEKKVFVSSELPAFSKDSMADLELHESMGALGYDDRAYALSSAIKLLSKTKEPQKLNQLLKVFGKEIFSKTKNLKDSGTSVGGGGDLIALVAKERSLSFLLTNRYPTLDFLAAYPRINFEPNYQADAQELAIDYDYDRYYTGPKREIITIVVPALLWQKDEASRLAIIQEALDSVLSFFPAYPNSETITFTPIACKNGEKITFPKPRNGVYRQIQEFRGSMIFNCGGESAIRFRYPYFPPARAVSPSRFSLGER